MTRPNSTTLLVALFQYHSDTRFLAGNPPPAGSLVAPTLTSREGRDRREPRSCIPRHLLAASRPCPPGGVGRGPITTPDDAPLPAASRKEQNHSCNSDEVRSSHRIERPQKRVRAVARPLQMVKRIDGQSVKRTAGLAQDSL